MTTLDAPEVDHFTPLSLAVASIDRDAYAERFAIYDQAHKELLRRLATAAPPPSSAEIEREEQAFRNAVRRVEFADELAQEEADSPALVPPHEPVGEEPLQELRRDAPWPEVRPRGDAAEAPDALAIGFERNEPDIALSSLEPARAPRAVMRRVGERLLLAVFALALGGVWLYVAESRQQTTDLAPATVAPVEAAAPPSEVAAPAGNAADAKPTAPGWLSPQLFYTAPQFPPASAARAPVRRP